MALNFPASPTGGQTYAYLGKTFQYDATYGVWRYLPDTEFFAINTQIELASSANEIVGRHICVEAFSIPAGATGSFSKWDVAATGSTTYTLKKNGTSFGTVLISAAGVTGAFTVASTTSFAVGDVYTVVAPGTADATLAAGAIVTRCTRLN